MTEYHCIKGVNIRGSARKLLAAETPRTDIHIGK